jgi:hypothetical protein
MNDEGGRQGPLGGVPYVYTTNDSGGYFKLVNREVNYSQIGLI